MAVRVRGGWFWCERKVDGLWEAAFVNNPDLDEWDHVNAALFEDEPSEIVRMGGKPGEGYKQIGTS